MAVKAAAPSSGRINHLSLDERLNRGFRAYRATLQEDRRRYADQNEQDYEEFAKAIRSGRLEAVEGV